MNIKSKIALVLLITVSSVSPVRSYDDQQQGIVISALVIFYSTWMVCTVCKMLIWGPFAKKPNPANTTPLHRAWRRGAWHRCDRLHDTHEPVHPTEKVDALARRA